MRPTAFLTVLIAGALAPVAAAQAPPRCFSDDPPVRVMSQSADGGGEITLLVRCRDRAVLLRRRSRGGRRPSGTRIRDADGLGPRVAWIEERVGRRPAARLVLAQMRGRRLRARRVLWRVRRGPRVFGVELVGRDVVWAAGPVLRAQAPGRRPRIIARSAKLGDTLEAEDARTVVGWDGEWRWFDVRPPRRAGGCPRRPRWRPRGATPEAVVTHTRIRVQTQSLDQFDLGAYRVCSPRTGRDPVSMVTRSSGQAGAVSALIARAGPWAAFTTYSFAYQDSGPAQIAVLRAGTDRPARSATLPWPAAVVEAALTPSGAPVARVQAVYAPLGEFVVTVTRDNRAVVLDAAPVHGITFVRADGETLRWRNGGEPREAPAG